ncbi:quinon protein alcohol dehydrogenase-like superfamily [Chiua virens]|nr:quinon protein alcohol dehydrogenase-like superfamily [Chiua virens]
MFHKLGRRRQKKSSDSSIAASIIVEQKGEKPYQDGQCKTIGSAIRTKTQALIYSRSSTPSPPPMPMEPRIRSRLIEIDGQECIYSVAFLADGRHILGGGYERKIRCWEADNGNEVMGTPMLVGGSVHDIAVSSDGKWIAGIGAALIKVWNAQSHDKVADFKGHTGTMYAIDFSPDGTRLVTGSSDNTVCVWSVLTGGRLLGPWRHGNLVVGVKFSPDGRFVATATWRRSSVRIYDSRSGLVLVDFPIQVGSDLNESLAWTRDSKQLFALSLDGSVYAVDTSTIRSQWAIHMGESKCRCIALACDGAVIAVSTDNSVSFWDSFTHKKIGSVIDHTNIVKSMAISIYDDFAVGHGKTISLRNLRDVLPAVYFGNKQENWGMRYENERSNEKIPGLEKSILDLRHQLAESQRTARELQTLNETKDRTVAALTADVDYWKRSDAAKAEQIAAIPKDLEQRYPESYELTSIRSELETAQSWIVEMQQQYDNQILELKAFVSANQPKIFAVQEFIIKADEYVERMIVETLQYLNTAIQSISVFITGYMLNGFESGAGRLTEERTSAGQRVADAIGQLLANCLGSTSRDDVALCLPIALRAYLTQYVHRMLSSWSVQQGHNQLLDEIYERVWKSESQVSSGRWRSLTRAHMSPTSPTVVNDPDVFVSAILDGLTDIVVAASCATSVSAAKSRISTKFQRRVSFIVSTAGQLNKMIADALSGDFRVMAVDPSHGEAFDDTRMEVDSGGGRAGGTRGQKVVCTTRLGLTKRTITPPESSTLREDVTVTVIKAKILFESSLDKTSG